MIIPNLHSTTLPNNTTLRLLKAHLQAGHLDNARKLFDTIPHPDARLWTILISAYTRHGYPRKAIKLYSQLLRRSKPTKSIDKFVLLPVARACANTLDLNSAKEIHLDAIRFGYHKDTMLANALIDMYGKCGYQQGARAVFDELHDKDVISWTSIINTYTSSNDPSEALHVFRDMGSSSSSSSSSSRVRPNSMTISSALRACSNLKALHSTREIHAFSIRNGLEENMFVSSALVDCYAKCQSLRFARLVFDRMPERDAVSWNVIIGAHFLNGGCKEALQIFGRMKMEGLAISNLATWNTVVSGCVQNGLMEQALGLLSQMQQLGFRPNKMTIVGILPACTNLESLRGGREIHGYCFRHLLSEDMIIASALIYMYAKCGDLDAARFIFNEMPRKDTVAWNTAILGVSMHGCGKEALALFNEMVVSGGKPNSVTFIAVLSACSHSQFVEEGRRIFNSMHADYGIKPGVDHYSCMVDVLSRSGCLEEAYEFIRNMPLVPSPGAWGALLSGCRIYKNFNLGKIAGGKLFEIEPDNPANYILLCNIYASAKKWEDASKLRKLMRDRGISKDPGCSWIQIKNNVYTFVKGDTRNAHSGSIYMFLEEVREKMKREGYSPDTGCVLQDLDEEEKEENLLAHSEKLAVAFGVLNSGCLSSIRVFKNLRICGDCHNVIRFISRSTKLRIVVRDSMRFHHFINGSCSCGDIW